MTTTLSEGVKVPDVGSVNWAGDLEVNWNLLNGALANLSGNVKLDRDNTWTGEQSFTLPIVGSITGTASKAIADEDGTNIKTGYVNVAGNQTVSGQKVWSGVNYFNNKNLYQTDANPQYAFKSSILEIGVQPSGHCTAAVAWLDNNDVELGYSRFVEYNNSIQTYEVLLKNKAENGSLSPAGNDISASLQLALFKTGSSQLNLGVDTVVPTSNNNVSLGSSSYQWSSVYAQTYYYNGTEFQSKFVTADTNQTITGAKTFSTPVKTAGHKLVGDFTDLNDAYYNNEVCGFTPSVLNNPTGGYGTVWTINAAVNVPDNPYTSWINQIAFYSTGIKRRYRSNGGAWSSWENVLIETNAKPSTTETYNLGTSTNKWKTLNGINPGVLSLPDNSGYTNISGNITDLTGSVNSYIPPSDGYVMVNVNPNGNNYAFVSLERVTVRSSSEATSGKNAMATIPVIGGKSIDISVIGASIAQARFTPCLGNV